MNEHESDPRTDRSRSPVPANDAGRRDIVIVDDEESMREFLEIVLMNEGYTVECVPDGEAALAAIAAHSPRLFVQDLRMGGLDGMDLLAEVKRRNPELPVLVMTAYSSWDTAVEAMRLGAFDYLKKPFDTDQVRSIVSRAILSVQDEASPDTSSRPIVGNTAPMQRVYDLVERVAPTDSTVLIRGESGSGKELVARSLHGMSHRAGQPFIAVNCSAFTENLLESELFGHVRGAFTGAVESRKGVFECAHGGTLFLDEVADMNPSTQVKILRALEERSVMPVGGTREIAVDVRIVAATNRNLEEDIREGRFREDLFYRLNVIPLELPPLRDRPEDIPLLAGHFLARYAKAMRRPVRRLSDSARVSLLSYDWPGNVRELENVIQRHVALCEGEVITAIDLPNRSHAPSPTWSTGEGARPSEPVFRVPDEGMVLDDVMEDIERRYLLSALERTEGNLTQAAKILGLSYRSIRYKVKKLGIREQSPA